MIRLKTFIKMICLLFLVITLGGCWDRKEIEKRAYVISIGLDKGTGDNLKISYLIANPDYGTQQQGGGTNEPPQEIISFETGDIITAETKANTVIAKEISYDLLRNIMVSEKLAKDKNFIRWLYDTTKEREIRRDVFLVVTKEDALKFFEQNSPKLESRAHKYFDLIIRRGLETGLIPNSQLHRYLRITESDADLFLAIYATTEHNPEEEKPSTEGDNLFAGQFNTTGETNRTQFLGSVIFKEGTMIGKLTGEETRIANILNDVEPAPEMVVSVPDPFNKNFRIAAKLKKLRKNKVDFKIKDQSGKLHITIPLRVDILTDQSMVNYAKSLDKRNELKSYLEERFSSKINKFIAKTQEEYKGEPFGWSLFARKKFLTLPEYEKFNWEKQYPDMEISTKVEITFGNFGRQSRMPKLKSVRE
ncbi:Ger(x)C family spore germination protein [Bacillus sp. S/N-304-OC-R1]|uniref:Ger(x)C family spore germination protein n=1 Tax=Bacillus sp. S/N-304-OC-R1 TaxID=2758034 RepID=UPI001C8EB91E|nr:Ger(x)C family spore germination protein [Bacillus sp. S/N-304-OC-R1]MBY0121705.1 Ger(x)C family spore germination protein [Bacillus sp. S/N-304-OC-R1]